MDPRPPASASPRMPDTASTVHVQRRLCTTFMRIMHMALTAVVVAACKLGHRAASSLLCSQGPSNQLATCCVERSVQPQSTDALNSELTLQPGSTVWLEVVATWTHTVHLVSQHGLLHLCDFICWPYNGDNELTGSDSLSSHCLMQLAGCRFNRSRRCLASIVICKSGKVCAQALGMLCLPLMS